MFAGQKNQNTKSRPKSAVRDNGAVTILTSGCHFVGKLYCRGASRIGGRIEGQIVSEGLLIIEDEAEIKAEIKAEEVIIQGNVEGRLEAAGKVELCSTGTLTGEIVTSNLVIREGAMFNGQCTMVATQESARRSGTPRIVAKNGRAVDGGPALGHELGGNSESDRAPELNVPTR